MDLSSPKEDAYAPPLRGRGHVASVSGSSATLLLTSERVHQEMATLTVGKLLSITSQGGMVVAVVTAIAERAGGNATAETDLLGEIVAGEDGGTFFQRGISVYPVIGDPVDLLTSDELRAIYEVSGPHTIDIGRLSQDPAIAAYIDVDEMVHKHFAVLGTTGVGKSSGVAVILREILRARPQQRIFLIDPHAEYGECFGRRAEVLSPTTLRLPFWLFNFEEIVDAIFRARPGVEEEVEILAQAIAAAKNRFANERDGVRTSIKKTAYERGGFTVDTPVPYRLKDLLDLIDERMGKLENRSAFPKYYRLMSRIETLSNDPRYRFMFENANVGGDTMADTLSGLFQLTEGESKVTVLQLAGFPAEVIDSLVSVLCRLAFEFGLWSAGAVPLLIVCEEAHRYAPADRAIGFGPTRKAVSRIAKEGRKYGVHLGLVTQRPAELDPTILSQCSTLFTMRMANERDQEIVRAAVSDAAASLLAFVPSLGTREVFAFGEGVALPTRLRFSQLAASDLPRSTAGAIRGNAIGTVDGTLVAAVIERWRSATTSRSVPGRPSGEPDDDEFGTWSDVGGAGFVTSRPEDGMADRVAATPRNATTEPARNLSPGAVRFGRVSNG